MRSPARLTVLAAAAAMAVAALPVQAQNAGQIARTRAGASCPGCNLFQADFGGLTLKGKNFAGARLRQADLSAGIFNHTRFSHTDMRDVNGYGALFSGADLAGANLTHATFVGAYFEGANLAGAILDGANFSGAELNRARGLSQARLNHACGDASTKLPAGMTIPSC
jgi:uncharacterized protein YjbI with pentapeptide repeats